MIGTMIDDGRLKSLVARVFEVPVASVGDDLGPGRLERWNSMGHMALVAAVEAEYRVTLSIDDVLEITSVGRLREILERIAPAPGR